LDTTEGVHKPLGKYIVNRIRFSSHDPAVPLLEAAGYDVMVDPYDTTGRLVAFPVSFEDVPFETVELDSGRVVEINTESAVDQLNRYKFMMDNYVKRHNCSNTISYSTDEVPAIVDWIYENWDSYVGVSFLYRNDPTKTAEDLGYPYLPQTVVTKEEYDEYVAKLKPIDLEQANTMEELMSDDCASGACPVK
jgi:ribonucleoside-triphosphate reductase